MTSSAADRWERVKRTQETLLAHLWEARTGNCSCGWEPASDRGAQRAHARHVAQVLVG